MIAIIELVLNYYKKRENEVNITRDTTVSSDIKLFLLLALFN